MTADSGARDRFDGASRRLITRHISSLGQLDLLVLLDEHRTRYWSAGNAATALRLAPTTVRAAAEALAAGNLLDVRFGEDALYRLDPVSPRISCTSSTGSPKRHHRPEALGTMIRVI